MVYHLVDKTTLLRQYAQNMNSRRLSSNTQIAYKHRILQFLEWQWLFDGSHFGDSNERDCLVRAYKSYLEQKGIGPRSVNAALTAITDLFKFLGLGKPDVSRKYTD